MDVMTRLLRNLAAAATLALAAAPALGQYQQPQSGALDGQFDSEALSEARQKAGVDEKIGDALPRGVTFTNSDGEQVTLGDVLDEGRPVIVQMAYYRCPALCGEVMNGMVRSMLALEGDLEIGRDFEVITASFDSRETVKLASENKDATVDVMTRGFDEQSVRDGWNFWVGDDLNIKRLVDALGFRFGWVESAQEYSHAGVIVLVTPEGRVSRYLHGTSFEPQTLRLSLVEASEGRLRPSLQDAVIYYCFDYDPSTGKYTATAMTVMKIGGAATVLTLGSIIALLIAAERRGRLRRHPNAGTPADESEGETYGGAFARRE